MNYDYMIEQAKMAARECDGVPINKPSKPRTTERPTPETDVIWKVIEQWNGLRPKEFYECGVVIHAGIAKLEQERDEAREELEKSHKLLELEKAANEDYVRKTRELLDEREELIERIKELETERPYCWKIL